MQDGTGLVEQIRVAGVNVVEVWHEDLHELGDGKDGNLGPSSIIDS